MRIIISVFDCVFLQFGSVGPMAITLSQSLGQNIGMLRNKERTAAGKTQCRAELKSCTRLTFEIRILWHTEEIMLDSVTAR